MPGLSVIIETAYIYRKYRNDREGRVTLYAFYPFFFEEIKKRDREGREQV